ncbi:hypothetical protein OZX69_09725 (plasmid) [Lactobacillus sp. ESL0731]|uniref:hypothetical protein n=1 Tax=unclassified Lactobacillus TaxID=2620435 RepID=UPI0023FA3821|nr:MULTISPECIES: hypothetical protein [unclassified Lactobacillus]WEV52078.1 hypothetical protein OZX63_09600 [Lactobacillus sp. ESL0700]WEV63231.1 hypothetical protein OZX69_09725 [Lactobacillus sp. ESL0731]
MKTKKYRVFWKTRADQGYNFTEVIVPASIHGKELNSEIKRAAISGAGLEFGYNEIVAS